MQGFLLTAQYGLDDVPLRLYNTEMVARAGVRWFRRLHPDRLHELANQSMAIMSRDASSQLVGAELALTEFDKHGRVVGHEVFGLETKPSVLADPPDGGAV